MKFIQVKPEKQQRFIGTQYYSSLILDQVAAQFVELMWNFSKSVRCMYILARFQSVKNQGMFTK